MTSPSFDTCPDCRKRSYRSRRDARRVAKRIPGHLGAYRCPEGRGWHIGHMWRDVLTGRRSRAEIERFKS